MDPKDIIKGAVLLCMFAIGGPALGFLIKNNPSWQRWVFGCMCFMTMGGVMGPSEWGLTLGSVEWYRGHTKGYHFYFNEVLAIALITAFFLNGKKDFRWIPPGFGLYLAYCFLSFLSITRTPMPNYVMMSFFKFIKVGVIFVATFNFLRKEKDIHFFIKVLAGMICWECFIALKLKYLDGVYQVRGTFEHQNPLAMYCVMAGMLLLACGMSPTPHKNSNFYLIGFMASAMIVVCSLSRGALAIFGLGTLGVMFFSMVDKPTPRRFGVLAGMGLCGALGLAVVADSIISRFNDKGNDASGKTRELMNAAAIHMLRDHPEGIGWNNYAHTINQPFPYGDVIDEYERDRGRKVDPDYAKGVVESHYWLLLSETGFQGYTSFMLMITVFLYWNIRGYFAYRGTMLSCVSLGAGMGCFTNYLQSLLERVLTQQRNMMLWLIVLGLTAAVESFRRRGKYMAKKK